MGKVAGSIVLVIACAVLLIIAIGYANGQAAERDRAEAAIIRARAESAAILMAVGLPWGVLFALSVFGLAVVTLAGAIIFKVKSSTQIIETRTVVYLPLPGQTRMQILQGISNLKQLPPGDSIQLAVEPSLPRPAGLAKIIDR